MTDEERRQAQQGRPPPDHEPRRRWGLSAFLAAIVVVPIAILIFSNLDSTEVSWAGFEFAQPLWLILLATFAAGMIGGKMFGWGWRRWRQRRRRLKDELEILRRHADEADQGRARDDD